MSSTEHQLQISAQANARAARVTPEPKQAHARADGMTPLHLAVAARNFAEPKDRA